jgi:hypothetical protein
MFRFGPVLIRELNVREETDIPLTEKNIRNAVSARPPALPEIISRSRTPVSL